MSWQRPLPSKYANLSDDELFEAIEKRRSQLGDQLVILGHHYQQDQTIRHADFTGDSFKLSQLAAEKVRQAGAKYVVFCGVHFMAEAADILTPKNVSVILPDMSAGCSMADMACHEDVVDAWDQIHQVISKNRASARVIPITYINSTAAIKAFVGEHGGAVCTSSNARAILQWAFAGGTEPRSDGEQIKVMFFPDQHLGRNTAADMGVDVNQQMCLWDPLSPMDLGGGNEQAIVRSDVILWKGHCSVHKLFRPEHADELRARDPGIQIIVHPECDRQVVLRSDIAGSTEKIIQVIEAAEPGSRWAVGTEVNLVNRIANKAAERGVLVRMLSECQCLCTTMYRIDQAHLLWVLDNLAEGNVVNQIVVEDEIRRWSTVALERMLDITGEAQKSIASAAE